MGCEFIFLSFHVEEGAVDGLSPLLVLPERIGTRPMSESHFTARYLWVYSTSVRNLQLAREAAQDGG
jgi:hypothetical protein